ncbi:MAG: hypothetical protein AB8F74_07600 [Saprospiraceae bacterium]
MRFISLLKISLAVVLLAVVQCTSIAQPNFSANDKVPAYNHPFGYGTNLGYYPPWKDHQLADIAAGNPTENIPGVGATAIRPALPEHFVEQYGYDIRLKEFQHYFEIGTRDNTVFIGYPSPAHKDTTRYCAEHPNESFANLYEPIWDNGENGTPVNEENYLASYLYKIVQLYGDNVKYWEISNEPDFDWTNHAWLPPGKPGNWWENNPPPCQNALKAPIHHYIRMLRVSYEVIKYLSPDDYVAIGGLGYPSFLDAVCRNTDNPNNGLTNKEFPLKGGAYFDCMSFHSYPHIDGSLRHWDNGIYDFVYERHSDKAVDGVVRLHGEFKSVLEKYGYGSSYPQKAFILTECNIPRVQRDVFIGSEEAQTNFLIKSLVVAQQIGIQQYLVFDLGETNTPEEASSEFQLMGFYKNLNTAPPGTEQINTSGIGFKTIATLLKKAKFDAQKTKDLQLPKGIRGAAFKQANNTYTYTLWAVTSKDQSEVANQVYHFPKTFKTDLLTVKDWDFSETKKERRIKGAKIELTGAPVFVEILSY